VSCVAAPSKPATPTDCTKATVPLQYANCSATVSELDTCQDEQFAALRKLGAGSCDGLKASATSVGLTAEGPACAALRVKCPPVKGE
jgi:hypothetical protein